MVCEAHYASSKHRRHHRFSPLSLASGEAMSQVVELRQSRQQSQQTDELNDTQTAMSDDMVVFTEMEQELFASIRCDLFHDFKDFKSEVYNHAECGFGRVDGLHTAATFGRVNMIRELLDLKASVSSVDVNTKNALEQTPLHCAAQSGFGDAIVALLEV